MAFKYDYPARRAFAVWLKALVLAAAFGWVASFIPSAPVLAQQQGFMSCDSSVNATAAAATATGIAAAATGSAKIHLCGYDLTAGGGTAQLSYGATCAALGTPISPLWPAATSVSVGASRDVVIPTGNAVCITSGAGGAASVEFYYTLQ
jgi:hypothetical protein